MDAVEIASETIQSEVNNLYGPKGVMAVAGALGTIYSMGAPGDHAAIMGQGVTVVSTGLMDIEELRGHYAASVKLEQCFGGDPIMRTRLALIGAEMWLAMYEGRGPETITIPEPEPVWTPW